MAIRLEILSFVTFLLTVSSSVAFSPQGLAFHRALRRSDCRIGKDITRSSLYAKDEAKSSNRRKLLASLPFLLTPRESQARGLVQFPVDYALSNTYHLMHAGTSLLEEEDIWSTNALFLTNREDCLSPKGREEVVKACEILRTSRPTLVKYSLAAASMDTADIVSQTLGIGRDRLVPEFTFMDPRGIGKWDMLSKKETEPVVWAMDNDQAGPDGVGAKPPANDDGTANETLADQAVRLRQLMSILETQFSGETILLCFPDGTTPALLSAMIAGVPYNRVHELELKTAEVRLDVTMESTLALWKEKQNDPEYKAYLALGREKLPALKARKEIISKKDQKLEAQRIEIDKQQAERDRERRDAEEEEERQRMERLEVVAASDNKVQQPLAYASLAALGASTAYFAVQSNTNNTSANELEFANNTSTSRSVGRTTNTASAPPPPVPKKTIELPKEVDLGELVTASNAQQSNTMTRTDSERTLKAVKSDKPLDRFEAASAAMEKYLDEDDGGDAWLQSMKELVSEEDDWQ